MLEIFPDNIFVQKYLFFAQGTEGDCWLLASIISLFHGGYDFTKLVQQNKKGDFLINLFGVDNTYTIEQETLKNYPQLNHLKRSFLRAENKNCANEIVYAPKEIVDGYERIIYLDKPYLVQKNSAKNYVVKDYIGYKLIDKISTDRSDFAHIFTYLLTLKNKRVKSLVAFTKTYAKDFENEQFLFALKVFIELGIFSIKEGILCYDEKIKNTLTNSKLYSKIVSLKR